MKIARTPEPRQPVDLDSRRSPEDREAVDRRRLRIALQRGHDRQAAHIMTTSATQWIIQDDIAACVGTVGPRAVGRLIAFRLAVLPTRDDRFTCLKEIHRTAPGGWDFEAASRTLADLAEVELAS